MRRLIRPAIIHISSLLLAIAVVSCSDAKKGGVNANAVAAKSRTYQVKFNSAVALELGPTDNSIQYVISEQPENGKLSGTGSIVIYNPETGFKGTDLFTFKLVKGSYQSEDATITLLVGEDTESAPEPTSSPSPNRPATPDTNPQSQPSNPVNPTSPVTTTKIAMGGDTACAITNGAASCWGDNSYGALGNGTKVNSNRPVAVLGLDSKVSAISTSGTSSCAVVNGAAKCWGSNNVGYGALGNNDTHDSYTPVPVLGLNSGVTAISMGTAFGCAIVNGGAWCWGNNAYGQLGNGTLIKSRIPVPVSGLQSGVTQISAGANSACAVANGAAYCWGYNATYGMLGNNSTINSKIPVPVTGMSYGITQISIGTYHACAIKSGGAWCWGNNGYGELGNGTKTMSRIPVQIASLNNVSYIDAGSNAQTTCATLSDSIQCWGNNASGQFGNQTSGNQSALPVSVKFPAASPGGVGVGNNGACGIFDSQAYCWGKNDKGQLGNDANQNSLVPVEVK